MDSNNALSDLLDVGLTIGQSYADKEIYGSQPASNQQLAQQTAYYNAVNGSGPVNQQAALNAPMSWTELFYGPPVTTGATGQPRSMSLAGKVIIGSLILLVIGGIIWVWKKL